MEVKNLKGLADGKRILVGLKRKLAAYSTAATAGAQKVQASTNIIHPPNKRYKRSTLEGYSGCCRCCSGKSLVRNYSNFMKSRPPERVMYYESGKWNDIPLGHICIFKEAFKDKQTAIEVVFHGHCTLIDFPHMSMVNLESGFQRSIAWIDESGKCFFPDLCSETNDEHVRYYSDLGKQELFGPPEPNGTREIKLEISVDFGRTNSSKAENCESSITPVKYSCIEGKPEDDKETDQNPSDDGNMYGETKETIDGSHSFELATGKIISSPSKDIKHDSQIPELKLMDKNLIKLPVNDSKYKDIKNNFLAGFGAFMRERNIIRIHQNSQTIGPVKARLESFQNQIEITKGRHGKANVRYAWFPSSKGALEVMLHGFAHIELPNCGVSYGIGLHLLPTGSSPISASFLDGDENDIQYMVLCRVILGNMEQVPQGSKQFQPSNEEFDNGTDDIKNPNYYIIWNCHVNTHIYPEYVVSLELPPESKGCFSGVGDNPCRDELPQVTNSTDENQFQPNPLTVDPLRISCHVSSRDESLEKETSGSSLKPSKAPTSAWMSFPMLLDAISDKISSVDKDSVHIYYDQFKRKKITRDDFIKKLRSIVGDKLLISTLKDFQCKAPVKQNI